MRGELGNKIILVAHFYLPVEQVLRMGIDGEDLSRDDLPPVCEASVAEVPSFGGDSEP